MNLFQRLVFRRLCNEVSVDGGEGGGGAPAQEPAPAKQDAPANGDNPAPAGTEPSKTDDKANPEPKGDDKRPVSAAPEKYEFTAGEGQELDKEAVAAFEPIARELGLSNEQAQKIVDVYGSTIMPQLVKQQADEWQKQVTGWAETVNADKEGLGSTESIGNAQKALDQFGSPELKSYLVETGLGNHPELVRVFSKIGKAMSEDGFVSGSSENARSAADVLFGDSK
ncbi:peptidase [Providencia sp. SP181]|uniref:peptidase n=1 Tax=Providencia sp. SP181 TaxID=3136277 RepID=UPI003D27E4AB